MTRIRAFQILVALHFVLSLVLQFRPFSDWFLTDKRAVGMLEYDGYASMLDGQSLIFSYLPPSALLVATIGLVLLRNWSRYLFLGVVVFGWISAPFFGIRVASPFDSLLGTPLGPLSGAILALAFMSPLVDLFLRKSPSES